MDDNGINYEDGHTFSLSVHRFTVYPLPVAPKATRVQRSGLPLFTSIYKFGRTVFCNWISMKILLIYPYFLNPRVYNVDDVRAVPLGM